LFFVLLEIKYFGVKTKIFIESKLKTLLVFPKSKTETMQDDFY